MEQLVAPSTPPRRMLTRAQRLEIHSLRRAGLTYNDISTIMRIPSTAVAYAAGHRPTL